MRCGASCCATAVGGVDRGVAAEAGLAVGSVPACLRRRPNCWSTQWHWCTNALASGWPALLPQRSAQMRRGGARRAAAAGRSATHGYGCQHGRRCGKPVTPRPAPGGTGRSAGRRRRMRGGADAAAQRSPAPAPTSPTRRSGYTRSSTGWRCTRSPPTQRICGPRRSSASCEPTCRRWSPVSPRRRPATLLREIPCGPAAR